MFVAWLVLALILYLPALAGGLLWDDAAHLPAPALQSWSGLWAIWSEPGATQQYYPVLFSAFWLEHQLWGDATIGYHLINVVLHTAFACLLAVFLRRLAVPGARWAALLFLVHPVAVESVAWISEQKNTLGGVLYVSAALAFLRFHQCRASRWYAVATALFVLALLTKSVTAVLPCVLLCLVWWKEGRLDLRREVAPLLPWIVVGAAAGLFTAHLERVHVGAEGADFNLSVLERLLLAGRILGFYASKVVYPADLSFTYPRWEVEAGRAEAYLPLVIVLGCFVLAGVRAVSRGRRGALVVLLVYAGTLFPVLGFLDVYPFVFSFVADHFQYFAMPAALAALVAASLGIAARGPAWVGRLLPVFGAVVVLVLAGLTHRQARHYTDATTLYRHVLAENPESWMAHANLGLILGAAAETRDAGLAHLETAVRLRPERAELQFNFANALARVAGRERDAEAAFQRALALRPGLPDVHNNLGLLYLNAFGDTGRAEEHFRSALRARPDDTAASANLGSLLATQPGRETEAIESLRQALARDPALHSMRHVLARVLARSPDRREEAVETYQQVVSALPDDMDARFELAVVLMRASSAEDRSRAALLLDEVLRREPDRSAARALLEELRAL